MWLHECTPTDLNTSLCEIHQQWYGCQMSKSHKCVCVSVFNPPLSGYPVSRSLTDCEPSPLLILLVFYFSRKINKNPTTVMHVAS